MNIRKKQTTSPPVRFTIKESQQSPRNAPQETIISTTSIQNYIEEEPNYRATGKFNTSTRRSEVAHQQQNRSPQFTLDYVEEISIVPGIVEGMEVPINQSRQKIATKIP